MKNEIQEVERIQEKLDEIYDEDSDYDFDKWCKYLDKLYLKNLEVISNEIGKLKRVIDTLQWHMYAVYIDSVDTKTYDCEILQTNINKHIKQILKLLYAEIEKKEKK